MASINGTNVLYPAFRNCVAGKTSDYTATQLFVTAAFTTNLYGFFNDFTTVDPQDTHVFVSSYAAGENPAFASRVALASVTAGTVSTGVLDAADTVFPALQSGVPGGNTSEESLIIFKYNVTAASAAGSAVLAHFGSATGLPLSPNGADVTVVWNGSGIWKY